MRQYALHKRLVADVDRFMNEKKWKVDGNGHVERDARGVKQYDAKNLEKVMLFVMQYLSLRQVHSDEISNEEIGYVMKKVNFGHEYEIPELYSILTRELTNQEYIFRIRRIKYLKNTPDSLVLVASPLMQELGKYMHKNTIRVNTKEVKLLKENEPMDNPVIGSVNNEVKNKLSGTIAEQPETMHVRKKTRNPDMALCASDPELDRIRQIWDDREERNTWISSNVLSASKKYGYSNSGKYSAGMVGRAVGVDQGTVLFYLRKMALSHSP